MMKTLILGYGNTLRKDDGLGVTAIEALSATALPADVEVLSRHQLSPELSARLSQVKQAIFIDVTLIANGELLGRIKTRELHPRTTQPSGITHHFDPETLLAMAETLYGHAPQATLFSVTANDFGLGEGLSPEVTRALPVLIERIKEYLFALPQN
ncbi:hydrogenase maturation protease [Anaerolineales bacterium]|nr:hydrogenase maturation protease [Anaerolineales bacterium]